MEKFLKVSTEEADGIPRVEVQRDRKNQSRTNLPKYVCTPTSQHPSPSSVPIKPRVSKEGSGSVLLAARGMWDWMVANLRLSGFIRPELAVSRGALEWIKGPL